jgi:prohibitin 2
VTKDIMRYTVIGLVVVMVLILLFKVSIIVGPGERAVIANRYTGSVRVIPTEGFHFLVPLIESVTRYDIKSRTYTMGVAPLEGEAKTDDSLQAPTADGQKVFLDISVRYRPDSQKLVQLHEEIGADYVIKVLRPAVRTVARMVTLEFNVMDIYSKRRPELQSRLRTRLSELLARDYIVIDDVLLRDVQFTPEFQKALENKQLAQQETERMALVLEKQELEKKRKLIEAEAEAESIRLRGKALTENPLLIQYEYIKLLAPNIQAIVTDQKSIFNFSDFMKNPKK